MELCRVVSPGCSEHRKREAQEALGVSVLLNLAVKENKDMNWFLPCTEPCCGWL